MDATAIAVSAGLGALLSPRTAKAADRYPPESGERLSARTVAAIAAVQAWLFGIVAANFGRWYVVAAYLFLVYVLVKLSVIDLRVHRLPDRITLWSLPVALVLVVGISLHLADDVGDAWTLITNALAGMVTYFVLLFLTHLISPRGMGFGDVKLSPLLGLYLGWLAGDKVEAVYLVLVALVAGCVLGVLLGLALRAGLRRHFAFGPALAAGAFYVIISAERFLD